MLSVNYKNLILEYAQRARIPGPIYTHAAYGPAHARVFKCICTFVSKKTEAEGPTKVGAEKNASKLMYELLMPERSKSTEEKTSSIAFYDHILTLIAKVYPEVDAVIAEAIAKSDADLDYVYGAAFLRYALAKILFNLYPTFDPHKLTAIIIEQVRAETLALLATKLDLTGAKAFLVLIGALARLHEPITFAFIELSYQESIKKCVSAIKGATMAAAKPLVSAKIITAIDNYKNKLQEYAQKRHRLLPQYHFIEAVGLSHVPTYTVVLVK